MKVLNILLFSLVLLLGITGCEDSNNSVNNKSNNTSQELLIEKVE